MILKQFQKEYIGDLKENQTLLEEIIIILIIIVIIKKMNLIMR